MILKSRSDLSESQLYGVDYIVDRRKAGIFLDMGSGKTVITLTALADMLAEILITKVLIVAPLKVSNNVWDVEAASWSHLNHLRVSVCTGTPEERRTALERDADIYVINFENFGWLFSNFKWTFDAVIIDESSAFRSHASKKFKALKKKLHTLEVIVLLSGTPSPKGAINLWSQIYLLDQGKRLGRNITQYRRKYFQQDYSGFGYTITKENYDIVKNLIDDICMTMDPSVKKVENRIEEYPVYMGEESEILYNKMLKEFFIEINGEIIEAPSAGVLSNKLLQITSGAIYDAEGNYHVIHDAKLDALEEILKAEPENNFLVAYNFKSDLKRLLERFPSARVLDNSNQVIRDWNAGEVKLLLAHPASAGHGLNLQFGGHRCVWFALTWNLELFMQFNARLARPGQLAEFVRTTILMSKNSKDKDVLRVLKDRGNVQNALLKHIRIEIKKRRLIGGA